MFNFKHDESKATIKLSMEQLSYVEIAIDVYSDQLYTLKARAIEDGDTMVNLSELSRRLTQLRRARRSILESMSNAQVFFYFAKTILTRVIVAISVGLILAYLASR